MAVHRPLMAWSFHADTSYPPIPHRAHPPSTPSIGGSVELPRPRDLSSASLTGALAARVSCRRFTGEPLGLDELSAVLHAAYGGPNGVHGEERSTRPVPSAGATYPLEIHLIVSSIAGLEPCTCRYMPLGHRLVLTGDAIAPDDIGELFLGQPYLAGASACAVIATTLGPSLSRYGDRGYRYVLLEAGHVAQNLNLASGALGLGNLNLGGFCDQLLGRALGLAEQVPLYGVAVGRPSTNDAEAVRLPVGGWLSHGGAQ